ncbi:uncharacterized protein LOC108022051 [Drosophila biarmipes]|uniref:uncharacterized protein LOC108022051 n=1 Tax=Drosophila biarmipes TaxID=125945 RepID=UPI0007E72F24|nr:uncharacterized protein LOC108022051 [Drosophila biarmipes]
MGISAKEKNHKTNSVFLGMEIKYNSTYVAYLGLAPGESQRLLLNSTKVVKTLFMDNRIENEATNRTAYNIKDFAACPFLNNRLLSKLFSVFYEEFVGNSTVFKCPIPPGVYYLKNNVSPVVVPSYHPPGKFRFIVRIKTEKEGSSTVELKWRYRVTRA